MTYILKAIELGPEYSETLSTAADFCFKLRQFDQAKDYYLQTLRDASGYQSAHLYLALSLLQLGST
jgi:tetratricopeptide (TPR) repeat protein